MMHRGEPVARRWRHGVQVIGLLAGLLALAPRVSRAQDVECEATDREVKALAFHGNHAFTSRDLALRVSTTPSDFLRRHLGAFGAKRCLDSDALHLDVARLRVFYRRHGYFDTAVDTSVTADRDGAVRVAFEIVEGEPVLIDTLRITGLDERIAPLVDTASLALHRGVIFDTNQLQATVDSMRARMRNNGYPRADVAVSSRADPPSHHATVNLDLVPGTRAHIAGVRVFDEPLAGGSPRVGTTTAARLLGVRAGDLYRERELVDAQRRLYQTDLFQKVEVRLAPDSLQPAGDTLMLVDLLVRENYLRQLEQEFGWAVLDCFKERVQFTDKNFLGEARRLDFTAQVSKVGYGTPTRFAGGNLCAPAIRADTFSARINYFVGATARFPTLLGLRTSPTLSIYSERRSEYQAFLRTTLVGGETSVSWDVRDGYPLRLAYSLEYGRTEAPQALLCAVFNRCDTESRKLITDRYRALAVGSAHIERVRSDNLVNPRSGTALRLDLRGASREIGSDRDIEFVKGLGDASFYHPVTSSITFAARLRFGAVVGRSLSFDDSLGFVPPEERLYGGGASSVRGFQQNALGDLIYIAESAPTQLGTGDTVYFRLNSDSTSVRRVVPVGGNSLIVANLELRIRSPVLPELLQFTTFVDGGDVWQRQSGALGRGHSLNSLYLNGLKWTPGIGVRVFTPVGPFQANVGYNPFPQPAGPIYYDKAPDPTKQGFAPLYCVSPGNTVPAVLGPNGYEQVSGYSCPTTFTPPQSNTTLRRLTFTFSIGPDF